MNHIYKVIFNKATGTFMAVAEYAKSHSTGGSCTTGQVGSVRTLSFARIAALAVLVIGATLSGSAYAQNNTKIAFGNGNTIGDNATATGEASLAIGSLAKARGNQSVAIGGSKPNLSSGNNGNVGPHAKGQESIAIGGDVLAEGDASIAIGSDDLYLKNVRSPWVQGLIQRHPVLRTLIDTYKRTTAEGHASTAVGTMSYAKGHFSNAFGTRAQALGDFSLAVGLTATAEKEYAVAIGSNAQVTQNAGIALGGNTIVSIPKGIALGFESEVTTTNNTRAYIPQNSGLTITQNHQATSNTGPLSIGKQGLRRRIINVGAGSQDTDAVNVAQLKAVEYLANRQITFKGDGDNNSVQKGLGDTLTIKGGKSTAGDLTDGNIGVVKEANNSGLKVKLAKNLSELKTVDTESLTASKEVQVGSSSATAKLLSGGLTFTQPNASPGKTVYGTDGVKFTDSQDAAIPDTTRITNGKIGFAKADGTVDDRAPSLDKKQLKVGNVTIDKDSGINAGNQKITKLANGTDDTDAVTIKQLKDAKPTLTGGAGISVTPTNNNDTLTVDDSGNVTTPSYTIGVKTTELNSTGTGTNKFTVTGGDTNNDNLVTAKHLASYLNQVNKTANDALPSFQVQKDDDSTNAITVAKNGVTGTVNTLKLKGENGVNIETNKTTGTVTFGINQKSGLTTPKLTVGSSEDGKTQLVIEQVLSTDGNSTKNIIKGLSSTLPNIANKHGRNSEQGNTIEEKDKSKAASIDDILNTGFNLKNNNNSVDFVSTYDIVDFANGEATTAKVTYDEASKTSKVTYDVNVDNKTIHLTGDDNGTKNKIGVKTIKLTETSTNGNATTFSTTDDDALVKASDIKDNLNTLATQIHTTKGTADTALQTFQVKKVNADGSDDDANAITVGKDSTSDKVNTLKLKGENGLTVTTSKTDGMVTFGIDTDKGLTTPKLTVGSNANGNNGVVIDSKDGQNTITGLSSTLTNVTNDGAGHTLTQGLADNTDKTRAASIGDVLNAGFNLQGNGTAVDFVSTYDTVNFTNGNATTATVTYNGNSKTSKVAYDVNVDDKTLEITSDKKLGVKTTTITKTDANGNATNFSATDGNALVKAKDIATHLNTLAGDIQTAKGASQAGNSAGYVDADGNKVIYDSTDKKYYQVNDNGQADKTKEVAKDKLVAQAQTPDGKLAQMNVKSVITKEKENDANGINEDNAFVKGLENAAKDTKTKNAAVTVNDLHQVASTPITFKSDDGVHSQVNLGDTFAMTGGADYTNLSDGKNIGVVSQPNGVQFKLAKDLTNLNSVSAGGTRIDEKGVSFVEPNGQAKANTPVLSANGLDMGGKRISNIGAAVNDNDAVNFKQFNEVAKTVNTLNNQSNSGASLPFVVTDANGNPVNGTDGKPQKAIKGTDGKYYQANANGVPVDKDGNPITDADKLANLAAHGKPLDTGHQVVAKLGGNSDAITLTNIKATLPQIATPNTGNNTNAGQAQSLPSLSAAQQTNAASVKDVLNAGFNLQTNNNQVDFVKAYDTVNFVNGAGADITSMRSADGTMSNITVNTALAATDDNGNVLIKAKDGKFYKADDLMPNGSLKAGKSASDAKTPAGLSLVNPNADKGSTGDAVALNNLSEAVFKAKDGTTTTVNSDGISIKGKDNSNIALSKDGLDMGGKVISNVGKGTKDTDAANMQQLNEVRSLLGLGNAGNGNAGSGNAGNAGNAGGGQVNIVDIKKDPNSGSGSSSNSPAIKAGTVLGGKGNNDAERLANGGVQVGVDKNGRANGDLNNVWVKTQKDGSKKALLTTYNVEGQTNYVTNNPAEAIDKMNEQGIRFFHVNDGNQEPVVQGRNSIDSSASGKHSAAVGYKAKANGEAAVAVGRQTQAGNQSIAIGDKAQATGNQSIAIGTGNVVTGKHSGAIGDPSTVKADNSYSVGNNNQFTDATQTDVFGVGNNITVTESNSVALGSNSAISAGTQAGTQAKKSDGTAGKTTTAGATGTVKGFAGQTAVGAVSVGASGAERRIQNVAAGEVSATSTDAVNGSQLYKATQGIANATNELGHRIHQNENKANAGISSAMAMASMPQAYIPGRSMVTGGIATYNGQGAVAVGLSKLSDNGQWVFKINGSADTQGNAGAAVGAGFHF